MNWTNAKLRDVCSLITDGTHKTPHYVDKGIHFISIANIRPYMPISFSDYERYVSEDEHKMLCKRVMPQREDILFPRIGTLGYAKRIDFDYEVSIFVGLGLARPRPEIILPKFLEYYMNTREIYNYSQKNANGTGRMTLPLEASREMPVRFPSLPEQERIVTRIEELFSKLDKAVETLQTTKQQLSVYRQAVLKEAFEGLHKKESIRNISQIVTSGSRGWAKYYSDEGARFIRITDLTRDRIILKNDALQYVKLPKTAEGKRSRLMPNDVLVSITADLGSIALIPNNIQEAYVNQHIAMIRFNNQQQGEFMAWYLKSDRGQKDLLRNKRGGGKLGLGLDDIRDTTVPLVSDEVADKVVEEIDAKVSVCDSIEQTVNAALAQANAMRQSILKQAFEGGFTHE